MHSPRIKKRGTQGFTLVELLVVIGIITLLLGILMPGLGKVRQISRRVACKAQLHSVAQAFRMYLDDNRNTMPPAAAMPWNPDDPTMPISDKLPLVKYLGTYLSVPNSELAETNGKNCYAKVLCCPGDIKSGDPKHYFRIQQSSYAYNEWRGNRSMNRASFTKNAPERDVEILWDFEAFHGTAGQAGAKNYLYSDCHVGNINGD
jgi:prepilin-type N-terminal cleavage/methylation domain-containing protein